MGYIINIGNAYVKLTEDNTFILGIEPKDDLILGSNIIHPSYSVWNNFMLKYKIMYSADKERYFPVDCYTKIQKFHVQMINYVYDKFVSENEGLKAKFNGTDLEADFMRLTWLKNWLNYAFENCENPCICIL